MKALPPLIRGFAREFLRCKECRQVYHHDYQPYSIGNPITWTPCGHSIGHRYGMNCDRITEDEYLRAIGAKPAPAPNPLFDMESCL